MKKFTLFLMIIMAISIQAQTVYRSSSKIFYQLNADNYWNSLSSMSEATHFVITDTTYSHRDNYDSTKVMNYKIISEEDIITPAGVQQHVKHVISDMKLNYRIIQGDYTITFMYKEDRQDFAIMYLVTKDEFNFSNR